MTADNPRAPERVWWQRAPAIVVALFLLFPIGLLLMWLYAPWSRRTKRIVTGAVVWPVGAWWISRSGVHRRMKIGAWVGAAAWVLILLVVAVPSQSPGQSSVTSGAIARASAPAPRATETSRAADVPTSPTTAPTPSATPSPTPVPTLSPTELAYRAAVISETQTMATSMSDFSALVSAPKLGDQTWTFAVATQLAIWRQTYADAQKLEAPPEFARTQERYLTALANLNAATFDFAKGVDNLDPTLISKASQEIQTANGALLEAVALMPTPTPQ